MMDRKDIVIGIISKLSSASDIDPGDKIADIGIDSLKAVELIIAAFRKSGAQGAMAGIEDSQ